MANLAVFLRPDGIGISQFKSPGNKPIFSAPVWRTMDDVDQLVREPLMLASLIREMVADEGRHNIYINVWPEAYNAIMFSHTKRSHNDVERLRQSELETVFHGEHTKKYTFDLLLDKGRVFPDGKCHRIIYVVDKEKVNLAFRTFAAQKLNLCRIAPMDAAAAESALRFWAPDKKAISACLMLDDACTSIALLRNGCIQAIRTLPDGFNTVLNNYSAITGMEGELARSLIRNNGVDVTDEKFDNPVLQDEVLRAINRISVQTVKMLHSTFGEHSKLDHVLLCGNFARTVGLREHMSTMLDVDCAIAGTDILNVKTVQSMVLDEADLEDIFPFAATAANGSDLMVEFKQARSDKTASIALCTLLGAATIALISATPVMRNNLQKEKDALESLLAQPQYAAVEKLFDQKTALQRKKNNLANAIAALPHGGSNTSGMISDLSAITNNYGTVKSVSVDYNSKSIKLTFTTMNYNAFVQWQNKVTENGRFSFEAPPTFKGNGVVYTVNAQLTAADFKS